MDLSTPRPRINASMIPAHHGKVVCLLGMTGAVDPNGNNFQLTSSDNQPVTVNLQEPLQEYVSGLVEVQGMVEANNQITCYNYVVFAPENEKNFDMGSYNRAVELMHQFPEHYITGIATT